MLNGQLSLLTPEGVRLALTPASPYLRFFAWLFDLFVYGISMSVFALIFGKSNLGKGLFTLVLFLMYWGYPIICEVYFNGQTLGKRVLGLQVLRQDGLPVGWRESSVRNLLLVGDFLPFLYLSGLLCMLFDVQFRRIGDLVAGTIVVYKPELKARSTRIEGESLPSAIALTPQQQSVLIGLFEREKQLSKQRMEELASLAEPITQAQGALSLQRLRSIVAGLTQ
jgi:uncharacterized RDD family membrane protein YckC